MVSLPFRPLPVVLTMQLVRLSAQGFLLVFCSNHCPKMNRCLGLEHATDRQTDGQIAALLTSSHRRTGPQKAQSVAESHMSTSRVVIQQHQNSLVSWTLTTAAAAAAALRPSVTQASTARYIV